MSEKRNRARRNRLKRRVFRRKRKDDEDNDSNISSPELYNANSLDVACGPDIERSRLHNAVINRGVDIEDLLCEGCDIDYESNRGTPLYLAVEYNNINALRRLLQAGASVNAVSKEDFPLHYSIVGRNRDAFDILLDAGADVNRESKRGTPLYLALHNVSILRTLITAGANVNLKSKGYAPLHYVIASRNQDALQVLVEAGVDLNIDMQSRELGMSLVKTEDIRCLTRTIENQTLSDLQTLTKEVYKSNKIKMVIWNILYIAACKGTAEICSYLINTGFPVNTMTVHDSVMKEVYGYDEISHDASLLSPLMVAAKFQRNVNFECLIKLTNNNVLEQSETPDFKDAFLEEICVRVKEMKKNLKPTVIPGRQEGSDVLVVYSDSLEQKEDLFCGKKILFRNPRIIARNETNNAYSRESFPKISNDDMNIARQIIDARAEDLWRAHTNLNMISVSPVKYVRGVRREQCCITLFCTSKGIIPYGEELYPTYLCTLDGKHSLSVDVREGYFELCPTYTTGHSRSFHHILKMGCTISKEQGSGGTLGPFVEKNGHIGFLTCAHVLYDIKQSPFTYDISSSCSRINVVQPASGTISLCQPGSDHLQSAVTTPCGLVHKAVFNPGLPISVDAAFVVITNPSRSPTRGQFAIDDTEILESTGFDKDWYPAYDSGIFKDPFQLNTATSVIVKFGGRTHLTRGLMTVQGVQVKPMKVDFGHPRLQASYTFTNQIQIEGLGHQAFFQPGDSGSAVFLVRDDRSLECIGIAIGCTSNYDAIVTPIRAVLEALGPGLHLKKFQ